MDFFYSKSRLSRRLKRHWTAGSTRIKSPQPHNASQISSLGNRPHSLAVKFRVNDGNNPSPTTDLEIIRQLPEVTSNDADHKIGVATGLKKFALGRVNSFHATERENDNHDMSVRLIPETTKSATIADSMERQSTDTSSLSNAEKIKKPRPRRRGAQALASIMRFFTSHRVSELMKSNEKTFDILPPSNLRSTKNASCNLEDVKKNFCSLHEPSLDSAGRPPELGDETRLSALPATCTETVRERLLGRSDDRIIAASGCQFRPTQERQSSLADAGMETYHRALTSSSVYSSDLDFDHGPSSNLTSQCSSHCKTFPNEAYFSMSRISKPFSSTSSRCSYRHQQAVFEFNHLAAQVGMDAIEDALADPTVSSPIYPNCKTGKSTQQEDCSSNNGKPVKNSIHLLRSKPTGRPILRYWRRQDDALNQEYYEMNGLKNKGLVYLARLGGCSVVFFPGDFAPSALKLPACFAATVSYLKCHALSTRHLFVEPGNMKVSFRIYNYFSQQVLLAERAKEEAEIFLRGCELPKDTWDCSPEPTPDETIRGRSVAWVLMQLLAGVPGGLLGSRRLLQTLISIKNNSFESYKCDEKRDGRLEGTALIISVRIRALALAMLAYTSHMQLELICAIFGLCSLMAYESERQIELHRNKERGIRRAVAIETVLDLDRLGRTFAQVLVNAGNHEKVERVGEIVCDDDKLEVVLMLIENWRGVSRQLRFWEMYGFPVEAQRK